jgi:hypothetical protein
MIRVLCAFLILAPASVGRSEVGKQIPLAQSRKQESIRANIVGDLLVVEGPCGKKPCCQPIKIRVPRGKVLSPKIGITLSTAPDGSVEKVEITPSSGSTYVDSHLREGISRWCMEKTKEGRDISFIILIHLDRS